MKAMRETVVFTGALLLAWAAAAPRTASGVEEPTVRAVPPGSLPLLVFLHDGYGSGKSFSGRKLDRILAGIGTSGG
jgi:hypothetical protein